MTWGRAGSLGRLPSSFILQDTGCSHSFSLPLSLSLFVLLFLHFESSNCETRNVLHSSSQFIVKSQDSVITIIVREHVVKVSGVVLLCATKWYNCNTIAT